MHWMMMMMMMLIEANVIIDEMLPKFKREIVKGKGWLFTGGCRASCRMSTVGRLSRLRPTRAFSSPATPSQQFACVEYRIGALTSTANEPIVYRFAIRFILLSYRNSAVFLQDIPVAVFVLLGCFFAVIVCC